MFRLAGGGRRVIQEIVAKFREKGATSPEKALTAQELGLGPRFEQAMKRRLGASGIFVDVGGKYYLDEAKLQQVQQERAAGHGGGMGGGRGPRGSMFALRIARMAIGLSAVVHRLVEPSLRAERISQDRRVGSRRPLDRPDGRPDDLPLQGEEKLEGSGDGGGNVCQHGAWHRLDRPLKGLM